MKKNHQKTLHAVREESILSDNCTCTNQIYYNDLKKRADLFTKDVATLTVQSQ